MGSIVTASKAEGKVRKGIIIDREWWDYGWL